jgi:hypothetical protein
MVITTCYSLRDIPSFLLELNVFLSLLLCICFCIIFPTVSAVLTAMQIITLVSPLTHSVFPINCITPNTQFKLNVAVT